jgi:hypothetical protein
MKRTRTRLALRLAASVLAGAVLTVAVAWACAMWSPAPLSRQTQLEVIEIGPDAKGRSLHTVRPSRRMLRMFKREVFRGHVIVGTEQANTGGGFRVLRVDMHNFLGAERSVCVLEAGWPSMGLASIGTYPTGRNMREVMLFGWRFSWSWSLPIPEGIDGRDLEAPMGFGRDKRRLPLLPLWPGFALDTAFYGALTFLLWSAPGVLRRRSRRRRGACPACGYDLKGGSAAGKCPECGR